MRVAALYDIHGNIAALDAVLREVRHEGVDAIVCGGDCVAGPFAVEVFDRLMSLEHCLFVRGNADREVVERRETHSAAMVAEMLGERRVAMIESWPLTLTLDVDDVGRVLFCHATPRSDEEILTRISPDAEFAAAFAADADAVVVGHTHMQFDRRVGDVRVVNAGSVGLPYEGRRGAFWLLLGPAVDHRRTDYDTDAAVEALRAAGRFEEFGELLREPPASDAVALHFEGLRGA